MKGTFYECRGDSLSTEELHLVTYPKLVGEMSSTEMSWLDDGLENCDASIWGAGKIPTSREMCACLHAEWVETIPQNFNNVFKGFALLFEISSRVSIFCLLFCISFLMFAMIIFLIELSPFVCKI